MRFKDFDPNQVLLGTEDAFRSNNYKLVLILDLQREKNNKSHGTHGVSQNQFEFAFYVLRHYQNFLIVKINTFLYSVLPSI